VRGGIGAARSYRTRIVGRLGLGWFVDVSGAAGGDNCCPEGKPDGERARKFRTYLTTPVSTKNTKNSDHPAYDEYKEVECGNLLPALQNEAGFAPLAAPTLVTPAATAGGA
jgi:hypothetical protein